MGYNVKNQKGQKDHLFLCSLDQLRTKIVVIREVLKNEPKRSKARRALEKRVAQITKELRKRDADAQSRGKGRSARDATE